jgi:Fur family peroxide stress response transcriptional regulator
MKRENRIYAEEIKKLLIEKGISPSYQRIRIFHFLTTNRIHPSAEMLYLQLIGEMPTLSRTTVYSTLNLFADKGMLKRIFIEGTLVRFDIDTSDHMHFKCTKCGEVFDIFKSAKKLLPKTEHKVINEEVYLYGICKNCK